MPLVMQHLLKGPARIAWAGVVASELLDEFYLAVDDPVTPLDTGLAGDTPCDACSSAQKFTCSVYRRAISNPPWRSWQGTVRRPGLRALFPASASGHPQGGLNTGMAVPPHRLVSVNSTAVRAPVVSQYDTVAGWESVTAQSG